MQPKVRPGVNTEELRLALEQVLSGHFGAPLRIHRMRRHVSVYSSSSTIENLEVELDSAPRLRLVFKNLSPASQLATAQQVRPPFLYKPQREIETYRTILHSRTLGTPICYGAIVCPERERYWLFLERVLGPMLWQIGRFAAWEQAACWLAGLHSEFASDQGPERHAGLVHLLKYDKPFFNVWLTRAEGFLRRKQAVESAYTWRRFMRLAHRYDRLIQRLLDLPTTFIHGEFYPSNVILRKSRRGRRVCPVDWEVAALAPGLIDLAALTAGDWTEEEKKRLVSVYRQALEPAKGWPPSLPELMEAVECCQLHLAMQLLGWTSDWSPPPAHAHNWLREAFRLEEKLGL